jgi:PncC family amidohydrolase
VSGDARAAAEAALAVCRERGWKLATAESCTGGLLGARLTDIPGASDVYVGGVVAYSDDVKRSLLGVPDETLHTHGAVSRQTAAAMARGVRGALSADVAVSVTGVAGPGGGTPAKPVGLVFVTVASHDGDVTEEFHFGGDRERIRADATVAALNLLRRVLPQSTTNARA